MIESTNIKGSTNVADISSDAALQLSVPSNNNIIMGGSTCVIQLKWIMQLSSEIMLVIDYR